MKTLDLFTAEYDLQFAEAIAIPFEAKIVRAIELIRKWEGHALDLSPNGYYVAFSGGKDSIVLDKLFSMAGVKYQAWYNNTTIDPLTNPPYSIYDHFLDHAFHIADNVVFFVPIAKAFKSNKVQRMVRKYGGLKELIYMGNGSRHGFAFGFPVGCLYYKRGYVGDCRITDVAT